VVKSVQPGGVGLRWSATPLELYKPLDADGDWAGISRQVLYAGSRGAATSFDVRYFELSASARSSLERHRHAHVVVALSGRGRVRIGRRWHRLGPLDACYIGPSVAHQLRSEGPEPFGFLCVVDAVRDSPAARARNQGRPLHEKGRAQRRRAATREPGGSK
jgi:quercetin dioxygenase-like cupin family protein